MDDAFAYAEKNGVESELSYPYTGTQQDCVAIVSKEIIRPNGYFEVSKTDSLLRRALVEVGPVSIAIDATEAFEAYGPQDYILTDNTCAKSSPDHALLLVGYNDLENYWIIKNSWGPEWGRQGYVYLNSTQANICGISEYATVPFVKPTSAEEIIHRGRSIDASVPVNS